MVLGMALAGAAPARATDVGGRLDVTPAWLEALDQRINAQPDPGPPRLYWEVGNGAASVEPPVVDVANEFGVFVRPSDARPLDPLPGEEPVIQIRNGAFQPAISFVGEGMSVVVRNADVFDHEVVVEEEQSHQPLPKEDLDGGRSFRVRFKTKGLYLLRCRNFSFLRGYVLVQSKQEPARFVRPQEDGSFALGDLPAGKYNVTVFNATAAAASAPTSLAGWVAGSCVVDVPAAPPPPPPPPAEAEPPRRRPDTAPPPPPPPPPPTTFRVTLQLGARGLECTSGWPPPATPAPAPPASGTPAGSPPAGGQ
jgi:plastocyanin